MDQPTDRPTPAQGVALQEEQVRLRYWAGARAAAGVEEDVVSASSVSQALAAAALLRPALVPVLPACSVLVDGRTVPRDASLAGATLVEVLPPFAGG